jgi:hypothetical protein
LGTLNYFMLYSIKFKDLNDLFKDFGLVVKEMDHIPVMGTWHTNVKITKNGQELFQLKNSRPGCGVTIIHAMGNLSYEWQDSTKELKEAIKELLEYIMYQNDTWCAFHHTSFANHPKYELMLKDLGFKIVSNFENGRHGGKKAQFLIKEFNEEYKKTLHKTFAAKVAAKNLPKPIKKAGTKKPTTKKVDEKPKRKLRKPGKPKAKAAGGLRTAKLIWADK